MRLGHRARQFKSRNVVDLTYDEQGAQVAVRLGIERQRDEGTRVQPKPLTEVYSGAAVFSLISREVVESLPPEDSVQIRNLAAILALE